MFCICGYIAIDETLNLFDQFGPIEGESDTFVYKSCFV